MGPLTGTDHCDTSHCIARRMPQDAFSGPGTVASAAGDASDSHGPPEWQERGASYRLIEVLDQATTRS